MADCSAYFREIRFVFEEELTQVYVFVDAIGDCPWTIQGVHHKTFPKSWDAVKILQSMAKDDPIMWPLKHPGEK